jgi:hypothetical protein
MPEELEVPTEHLHEKMEEQAHHGGRWIAVTFFQVAIAMGAIAVLAKRPKLWFVSLGLGAAGLVFLGQGLI